MVFITMVQRPQVIQILSVCSQAVKELLFLVNLAMGVYIMEVTTYHQR